MVVAYRNARYFYRELQSRRTAAAMNVSVGFLIKTSSADTKSVPAPEIPDSCCLHYMLDKLV